MAILIYASLVFLTSGIGTVVGIIGVIAGLRALWSVDWAGQSRRAIRAGAVSLVLGSALLALLLVVDRGLNLVSYVTMALYCEPPLLGGMTAVSIGTHARLLPRGTPGSRRGSGFRLSLLLLAVGLIAIAIGVPIQLGRSQQTRDDRMNLGFTKSHMDAVERRAEETIGDVTSDNLLPIGRVRARRRALEYANDAVETAQRGVTLSERLRRSARTASGRKQYLEDLRYFDDRLKKYRKIIATLNEAER